MLPTQTILVTGATGVIGADVCAALAATPGVRVRAGIRNAGKRAVLPEAVDTVSMDFEDPLSLDAALKDVDKVFLLTAGGPTGPVHTRAMTERIAGTKVSHIVKQSSFTPRRKPQAPTDLWALEAEEAVIETGRSWTFLEPPWINQNFTRGYFFPMVAQRLLALPFGTGRSGWIDGRDVALVAARALTETGHEGRRYCLTGPEALSLPEIAEILSSVTGTEIEYRQLSDDEWIEASLKQGAPREVAQATLALISKTRDGHAEEIAEDFEEVCGMPPRSFQEFGQDHRQVLLDLLKTPKP